MADVKERPILFSGAMVRAILDGRKMQTRRVVKPQPPEGAERYAAIALMPPPSPSRIYDFKWMPSFSAAPRCPYGKPGDRLWVRETFFSWRCKTYTHEGMKEGPDQCVYRADGGTLLNRAKWRPSIFMPRWASRITLEITEVRVQRLQDISEQDAKAEGADPIAEEVSSDPAIRYRAAFHSLWTSINGLDSWEANPWVWALTFRRVA